MINTRIYPFERNKFFYGKLLTVRDFESEQKYFNDKRRLVNKLLHGAGVVCGLNVVAVNDKKSISIESGVALDYSGREIVVSQSVTRKLTEIDGFKSNDYIKNVYLCIEYHEEDKEMVHSLAGKSDESKDYNRILENYRLVIKDEAREMSYINYSGLVESCLDVYCDSKLGICLVVPRYAKPDEVVEVKVKIDKTLQVQMLNLELDAQLEGLTSMDGESKVKFSFAEGAGIRENAYTGTFYVKATGQAGEAGKIRINARDVRLNVGDRAYVVENNSECSIEIINRSVKEQAFSKYYDQTLDQCLEYSDEHCIYLAKICLLQVNSTYEIEKVEMVPFDQYVPNYSLWDRLEKLQVKKDTGHTEGINGAYGAVKLLKNTQNPTFDVNFNKDNRMMDFQLGIPVPDFSDRISSGIVEIKFGDDVKSGDVIYSDEISHKLGEGNVNIHLGVLENDDALGEEQYYVGNIGVFKDTGTFPDVSLGAVVYPSKGTFKIGFRIKNTYGFKSVNVKWWSVRV